MKKIFTLFLVLFLVNQINGTPPETFTEKIKLPESIDRYMNPAREKSHTNRLRHGVHKLSHQEFIAAMTDKSQKSTLDSIVSIYTNEPDEKLTFLYDGQGKTMAFIISERDNGEWVEFSRMLYTYNPNGSIQTMDLQDYDEDTETVEPVVRFTYTYDANGNVSQIDIYFHEEGEWGLLMKDEYTYDGDNNLITEISSINLGTSWMGMSKSVYTYSDGKKSLAVHYNSDYIGGWIESKREMYSYFPSGQLSNLVIYVWEDSKWVFDRDESYQYSGSLITSQLTRFWDQEEGVWVNQYRDLYTYSGDRLIQFNAMVWGEGQWEDDYKEEMTWDNHGNLLTNIYSEWTDGAWLPVFKEEYNYDTSQTAENLIYPVIWYYGMMSAGMWDDYFRTMITSTRFYDWVDGSWVVDTESTYYWSKSSATGTGEIPFASINGVFPNPATDRVSIVFDGDVQNLYVAMYDLRGRMVLGQAVQNNGYLFVGHLHKGIYMIVVRDQEKMLMMPQKLIVR